MTVHDPHFDASDNDWIDCPICAGKPDCALCSGAGGFLAEPLSELHDFDNLKSINGEFA